MKTKAGKKVLLTLVCAALTIALSACSGGKADEASSQITIGIPQDVDSLDPHKAVAAGTDEVLFNVFEGLVKPDSEGNLNDAVAESHTISEDGKVYTFTLREGVKFHDGTAVTAQDVKYSLDRCADAGSGAPLVSAFSAIDSINVVDDKTVEIVLKEGDTDFLPYLTVAIIPESNQDPEGNPIGTGPYKFVSRTPQESIVLQKFDDYWGTPANIETVKLQIIANADTIVTSLNGGGVDMFARITQAQADQLSDQFDVLEGTMNLVQAMYLNNAKAPFDNEKVRQALCYAVDPQGIMDMISDGKGTQIGSSMFPAFGKYYMPELNDLYPTDIEKAKQLLAEAGYPDGFRFTLTVPSNYQQHVDTAQVIAEQLKQIGVTADIQLVEWESWLSDVYTDRNYEATVVGVDASSLTAAALLRRFTSDAPNNFINFKDPAYDEAFAAAQESTDDAEKTAHYKECETILAEDAANVYIQDLPSFVALNKKYGGYEFYPLYVQDFAKLYLVDEQANQ
ncbi:MAG: ABC transporter substrate-binding protein [Eubacteriales bacterium]|nr:ABC transporter substrate-binding protein [Eubacteriales bacterium]